MLPRRIVALWSTLFLPCRAGFVFDPIERDGCICVLAIDFEFLCTKFVKESKVTIVVDWSCLFEFFFFFLFFTFVSDRIPANYLNFLFTILVCNVCTCTNWIWPLITESTLSIDYDYDVCLQSVWVWVMLTFVKTNAYIWHQFGGFCHFYAQSSYLVPKNFEV